MRTLTISKNIDTYRQYIIYIVEWQCIMVLDDVPCEYHTGHNMTATHPGR